MSPKSAAFAAAAAYAVVADAQMYTNPVLARDFPDPTVMRGNDGNFYAYATMGSGHRLQVAASPNLIDWTYHGEALDAPSWLGPNSWAPDVQFHDGLYYMYYAGSNGTSGNMCIGVATSKNPLGPFTDARGGSPMYCDPSFEAIDPKSYDDPASGNTYMYFGSDFYPLHAIQLSSNRTSIAVGAVATIVLQPNASSAYENLIEGSWLHLDDAGWYNLFYSGDNCCGANARYAVMVARSASPTGPFERLGTADGSGSSIILSEDTGNTGFVAPGHNSLVVDDAGQVWMYYHAYATGTNVGGPRMLMMDRVWFNSTTGTSTSSNGNSGKGSPDASAPWPSLGNGGQPSSTPQQGPVVKKTTTAQKVALK